MIFEHEGHDTAMGVSVQAANVATVLLHSGGQLERHALLSALSAPLSTYIDTFDSLVGLRYINELEAIHRGRRTGDITYALTAEGATFARPTFTVDHAATRELLADNDDDIYDGWGVPGDVSDSTVRDIADNLAFLAGNGVLAAYDGYDVTVMVFAGRAEDRWEYAVRVDTPKRGSLLGPVQSVDWLVDDTDEPDADGTGIARLMLAVSRVKTDANRMVRKSLGIQPA